ncbi:hypothetical protein K474DRAFT_1662142 [Panus rudis PR-1116 ss-1]|nr:hypothetical protein K474DRAFT_1662142 [Panus rudis PR-1116 ss-1]
MSSNINNNPIKALDDIELLTFESDALMVSDEGQVVPRMTCASDACHSYVPDIVYCINTGRHGLEVDWKCEADLPSNLRFGRVQIACKGWSRPSNPHVLEDTCRLQYTLVQLLFAHPIVPNTADAIVFLTILAFVVYFFIVPAIRSLSTAGVSGEEARSDALGQDSDQLQAIVRVQKEDGTESKTSSTPRLSRFGLTRTMSNLFGRSTQAGNTFGFGSGETFRGGLFAQTRSASESVHNPWSSGSFRRSDDTSSQSTIPSFSSITTSTTEYVNESTNGDTWHVEEQSED